ncbi:MAG: LPS export ABC transporter periplasmic protein LptC [Rhodospirillales bacterium]|nr:LPS export ABC transporter periplasmic protein LptC [Rhodospirillales bacterium]
MTTEQDIEERRTRLGAFAHHDATDLRPAGRAYSQWVRFLRITLPLAAVILIFVLIFTSGREAPVLPVEELPIPTLPDGASPQIEKNELISPHFESETKDGKVYVITADRATQELRQPDLVLLENPRGILQTTPAPLVISARDGTYNQKTQFITLNQDISIAQDGVGTISLQTLEADLTRGELISPHPIHAEGPYGTIEADSLKISNDGMVLIFNGPVRLELTEGLESWLK